MLEHIMCCFCLPLLKIWLQPTSNHTNNTLVQQVIHDNVTGCGGGAPQSVRPSFIHLNLFTLCSQMNWCSHVTPGSLFGLNYALQTFDTVRYRMSSDR